MNLLTVKENYGKMFKETFGKESKALVALNLSYAQAREMSVKELQDMIKLIESEMEYLYENCAIDMKKVYLLHSWCINMVQNIHYAITIAEGNKESIPF